MNAGPTDDTHPYIKALLVDGYSKMSPTEKLDQVRRLTLAVQELALADIRRRHPHSDEREQALRLASRWIDPDLMKRAFAGTFEQRDTDAFRSADRDREAGRCRL
jgi:hypothetical protein